MQKKSLDSSPDETRTFEKGKIDLVNLGDVTTVRARYEDRFWFKMHTLFLRGVKFAPDFFIFNSHICDLCIP